MGFGRENEIPAQGAVWSLAMVTSNSIILIPRDKGLFRLRMKRADHTDDHAKVVPREEHNGHASWRIKAELLPSS